MKKYYVYVHVCPNEKRYVGCTTQAKPEHRWQEGRGYRGQPFEEGIRKYGWDNIEHEVFEVDSKEEMYRKEVELISFYHSNDPEYGYNCSIGGEKGALGCTRSEKFRKRVSESVKERCSDPEYRRKMSETAKKVHSDPEYRKHMVEAQKKVHADPEYRKKMSEAQKKVHLDPEYRRKISEAQKGKPKPKIKIQLPDGTIVEITKQNLTKHYINKGKKFEYVS